MSDKTDPDNTISNCLLYLKEFTSGCAKATKILQGLENAIKDIQNERGINTQIDCCICSFRNYGTLMGAGDGTGQNFAHPGCYYGRELYRLEERCQKI